MLDIPVKIGYLPTSQQLCKNSLKIMHLRRSTALTSKASGMHLKHAVNAGPKLKEPVRKNTESAFAALFLISAQGLKVLSFL